MNKNLNNDRSELRKLNAQFIKNYTNNDVTNHNMIIHRDFIYISSSGKILSREDYMKGWAHAWNDKTDRSYKYKNESIRIFDNMALIRCNGYLTSIRNGRNTITETVYTDTYIKENGRWRCVQAQITEVK